MTNMLSEMLETLNDPQARHAAFVHLPIALSLIGVLLALISAIWASKSPALRAIVIGAYVLMAVSAWRAAEAGEEAEEHVGAGISAEAEELIEEHEHQAMWISRFAAGMVILLAVGVVKKPVVRHGAGWLAVAGSVGLAGWTGYAAHLGGELVYTHGVGIPQATGAGGSAAEGADPREVFFVAQVRPILEEHCMRCHKPSRLDRVGGLDQTTMAGLLKGGVSGPGLVPGWPDDSLVIQAARHEIEDLEMPPDDDQLPDESIAILEKWIEDGAVWGE